MSLQHRYPRYHAQVLRMWDDQPTRRSPVWRFSLENVETGKRRGFADLDALITHLLVLMEDQLEQDSQEIQNRYTQES